MATRATKLSKQDCITRINELIANQAEKYTKYQRNYMLYNQSAIADLKGRIPSTVGLFDDIFSEDATIPKLNVIKSAIDAVVNKISTAHVRPFVNTVKGSFKTIQICKQLQVFFDYFYDEKNVGVKIGEALRNACIFDSGYIYLDETDGNVYSINPWNVYTRQREKGDFKSAYIEFPSMSNDMLRDEDYELLNAAEKKAMYVTLGYFYDSRTRTKATLINRQIRNISQTQSDAVPLVPIFYTMPIEGTTVLSVTDMLRGIQIEIDELMKRIAEASMLNPALTFFVSNASNIKVGKLNNKVGNIVQYNCPDGSQPVTISHDEFISTEYSSLLNDLIEKAYNLVGISQLSAQGKKPAGLDSGVALATQADLESDRFQVLLDQYIRMYTDVAKLCMRTFQANKDIIKPNRYNLSLTWSDVEKEYDKMRVQFSAADSLSKDPSEKLKQLQTLAQAGIIPSTMIPSLLELPDINRGYSAANNAWNACQTLIDQCIYDDKYELPDFVPYTMLKEQIINMELSLRTAQGAESGNEDDIRRLQKYYEKIEDREAELQEDAQSGMQNQSVNQDVSENNMYSSQNNENFGNGTEDNLNMSNEGTANPMQTDAANGGELGAAE